MYLVVVCFLIRQNVCKIYMPVRDNIFSFSNKPLQEALVQDLHRYLKARSWNKNKILLKKLNEHEPDVLYSFLILLQLRLRWNTFVILVYVQNECGCQLESTYSPRNLLLFFMVTGGRIEHNRKNLNFLWC